MSREKPDLPIQGTLEIQGRIVPVLASLILMLALLLSFAAWGSLPTRYGGLCPLAQRTPNPMPTLAGLRRP